jgi:hypothetical protein
MTARRAAWTAGGGMLLVYLLTLAPSVTFWDAGEFIAAARTLGIPHPPGTPLFILLLNTWARMLGFLPFAAATNSFSAVCSAAAVGLTAYWIARATESAWAGVAAAVCAGAMSSVWQNATETEVYAGALMFAVVAIVAADASGRSGRRRWLLLAVYCLALALPFHLSTIVAAPVVALLAVDAIGGRRDWGAGLAIVGVTLVVIGVSRLSWVLPAGGLVLLGAAPVVGRSRASWNDGAVRREQLALLGVVVLAASALLVMIVRARFDPAINQANPASLRRLGYVVARQQYDLPGVWPRQVAPWIQIANWFEYADWQFALSLGPTVIPTVPRVLATLVFVFVAAIGAQWHHRRDPRSWRAVLLLFVCGSLGVIFYLNLRAGTSFGWSFLPQAVHHEARERDYFFVFGFWAWGIWAGCGAMVAGRRGVAWLRGWHRHRRASRGIGAAVTDVPFAGGRRFAGAATACGLAIAALPIALNWAAVNRRSEPDASMPRQVAAALLTPLPTRAVLFVAGDNDTYPLWYAQQVEHLRPDVTIVTLPLLNARWYSEELQRRYGLVGPTPEYVAAAARRLGRPVAVSLTVPGADRDRLAISWTVLGAVAVDAFSLGPDQRHLRALAMNRASVAQQAERIAAWRRGRMPRPSTDPVYDYFAEVLSCPATMLVRLPSAAQLASLDSTCNLR